MSRILIVGGGYIGLYAARHLERLLPANAHQLVMVSTVNHMTYQPFLPEVASGVDRPRAVAPPGAATHTEPRRGEVEDRGRSPLGADPASDGRRRMNRSTWP
jgi:NADH dehydrogenase FAD-containing subunit